MVALSLLKPPEERKGARPMRGFGRAFSNETRPILKSAAVGRLPDKGKRGQRPGKWRPLLSSRPFPAAVSHGLPDPDGQGIRNYHAQGRAEPNLDRRVLACLLYTSDAADDLLCVDLGG